MATSSAFHGLLRFTSHTLKVCAWLYLIVVVVAGITLRTSGERWWPATVLLFAPRWAWGLPLAVLAPPALGLGIGSWWLGKWKADLRFRVHGSTKEHNPKRTSNNSQALLLPVVLAALWVAWPLMGFCCSWSVVSRQWSVASGQRATDNGQRTTICVLTCNVGLDGYDDKKLGRLVKEAQPDVVTLQEGYGEWIVDSGEWSVDKNNGLLLASRFPIVSQQVLERKTSYGRTRTVGVAYQLDAPEAPFTFVSLHLYTPRKGLMSTPTRPWEGNPELEENTAWRVQESADVAKWVEGLPRPVIVAGDMNLTPDSEIFRRDWSRFTDAFSATGFGYGYTYGYDASRPCWGIRIDHILADTNWRVEHSWVGPHIHSDHRPVLARLRRLGTAIAVKHTTLVRP